MGHRIIVITAGHGGSDSGAVSPDGRWIEAKEALRLRDGVAATLRAGGVAVITDGNPGQNAPLKEALKLLRRPGLLAVEIHFNAGPAAATGVEALAIPEMRSEAQALAQATARTLGLPLRGDGGWKPDNSGQHPRLAFCRAGGVILEVAFISNPQDMASWQRNFAALAQSLAQCLTALAQT